MPWWHPLSSIAFIVIHGIHCLVIHCHSCHPLSFMSPIVIHCHPFPSIVIHCHLFPSIVIHCHLFPSIVIVIHNVIPVIHVIYCHPLASKCHTLSSMTSYGLLSPHWLLIDSFVSLTHLTHLTPLQQLPSIMLSIVIHVIHCHSCHPLSSTVIHCH